MVSRVLKKCHQCLVIHSRTGDFCSNSCQQIFRWKRHVPKDRNEEVEKFRRKVSNTIFNAKKKGLIVEPDHCEKCGKDFPLEAHHEDYRNLLEVIWYCRPCHRARHLELTLAGIKLPGRP